MKFGLTLTLTYHIEQIKFVQPTDKNIALNCILRLSLAMGYCSVNTGLNRVQKGTRTKICDVGKTFHLLGIH